MPDAMAPWPLRISLYLLLGVVTTVAVAWGLAFCVTWTTEADKEGTIVRGDVVWLAAAQWTFGTVRFRSVVSQVEEGAEAKYLPWTTPAAPDELTNDSIPAWSRMSRPYTSDELGPVSRSAPRQVLQTPDLGKADEVAFGWPCLCLRSHVSVSSIEIRASSSTQSWRHVESDRFWYTADDGQRYVEPLEPGDGVRGGVMLKTQFNTANLAPWLEHYRVLPLRPIFPGFLVNTLFYAVIWFGIFFGVGFVKRVLRRKRGRCVKCSYDLRGEFDSGCPECGWERQP